MNKQGSMAIEAERRQDNAKEVSRQVPEPVMNRWLVVVGAVLIQLCLGALYAWPVFTPYLLKAPFNFSKTETQVIFSVGLAAFAIMTIVGNRWQIKVGPAVALRVGALVMAAGYILGGLVERFLSGPSLFWGQLVGISLIGGAGVGLCYVVPIAASIKWFPDRKGLITGLSVAGFGFGALLWIYLGQGFLGWAGLLSSCGVSNVFIIYGFVFLLMILFGSIWMKNPPAGWTPPGWAGGAAGAALSAVEFEPRQMLATPQFYMLWLMYVLGALAGLMVIGIIKLFGIEALQARSGLTAIEASAAAGTAMAVFYAIANGTGRIIWGLASDKLGRKLSLFLMMGIQGVVMLLFHQMGGVRGTLFLGAALVGFNYGGIFALFPAATADFFGVKSLGKNYGWIFSAYGVGGIVGPIMAGRFSDAAKGAVAQCTDPAQAMNLAMDAWKMPFVIAGIGCLLAAFMALLLRPPKKN